MYVFLELSSLLLREVCGIKKPIDFKESNLHVRWSCITQRDEFYQITNFCLDILVERDNFEQRDTIQVGCRDLHLDFDDVEWNAIVPDHNCTTQNHLQTKQFVNGTWIPAEWLPVRSETNRPSGSMGPDGLFVAQSSSEIPEGLMNNPVYVQSDKKSLCTWWLQYNHQVHRDFLIILHLTSLKNYLTGLHFTFRIS